jgi:hypothetical protein
MFDEIGKTVEDATLEWVDWFNNRGLLSLFGDIPPAEAEAAYSMGLEEQAALAAWLKRNSVRENRDNSGSPVRRHHVKGSAGDFINCDARKLGGDTGLSGGLTRPRHSRRGRSKLRIVFWDEMRHAGIRHAGISAVVP